MFRLGENPSSYQFHILKEGYYRIFAKGNEGPAFRKPVFQIPSWYISNTKSTNDPYTGRIFRLGPSNSKVKGLKIKMIDTSPPFNLFWSRKDPSVEASHSFIRPGTSATFKLTYIEDQIKSVEAYGSNPDYSFTDFSGPLFDGSYSLTVTAENGAEEGERLMIARGKNEIIQAGLVGVHIVSSSTPDFIAYNHHGKIIDFEAQLKGEFDFKLLDPFYWK